MDIQTTQSERMIEYIMRWYTYVTVLFIFPVPAASTLPCRTLTYVATALYKETEIRLDRGLRLGVFVHLHSIYVFIPTTQCLIIRIASYARGKDILTTS